MPRSSEQVASDIDKILHNNIKKATSCCHLKINVAQLISAFTKTIVRGIELAVFCEAWLKSNRTLNRLSVLKTSKQIPINCLPFVIGLLTCHFYIHASSCKKSDWSIHCDREKVCLITLQVLLPVLGTGLPCPNAFCGLCLRRLQEQIQPISEVFPLAESWISLLFLTLAAWHVSQNIKLIQILTKLQCQFFLKLISMLSNPNMLVQCLFKPGQNLIMKPNNQPGLQTAPLPSKASLITKCNIIQSTFGLDTQPTHTRAHSHPQDYCCLQ